MTSNKVVNLNKVRAAASTDRAESAVFIFDYHAPESEAGQVEQTPLVKVIPDSLKQLDDGDWMFKGINLYRVDGTKNPGYRTYKLSRINGRLRRPN